MNYIDVERVDPGDRGSEYRSLIGLPGGMNHPLYPAVEEAGKAKGFALEAGKGNDPDTFGKKLVYVYDSSKFPFFQAEVYHQVSTLDLNVMELNENAAHRPFL